MKKQSCNCQCPVEKDEFFDKHMLRSRADSQNTDERCKWIFSEVLKIAALLSGGRKINAP